MAACGSSAVLTIALLSVQRYVSSLPPQEPPSQPLATPFRTADGVRLDVDPSVAQAIAPASENPVATLVRGSANDQPLQQVSSFLRRPPEPATDVVLFAPVAQQEFIELPLHTNRNGITYLMDTFDEAFARPIRAVSGQISVTDSLHEDIDLEPQVKVPPPVGLRQKLPQVAALNEQFAALREMLQSRLASRQMDTHYIRSMPTVGLEPPSLQAPSEYPHAVDEWLVACQKLLKQITQEIGLTHQESPSALQELTAFATQAKTIADSLSDYELAAYIMQISYSLRKRAEIWSSIHEGLDATSVGLSTPRTAGPAAEELLASIQAAQHRVDQTGDSQGWNTFLLLDELADWAQSDQVTWAADAELPQLCKARLHSPQLSEAQSRFLLEPEFQQLSAHLTAWGRGPVDYRELLSHVESLEVDPISRIGTDIADSIQVLRLSDDAGQQAVGQQMEAHYRNANLRLSVTADLLERFLPESEHEVRPIRKRILGADTRGSSRVQTDLRMKLIPDESAWHVDLEVFGDLLSNTRSSKGPATFHSTSQAEVQTHRYLRLDPQGYEISSQPASVQSRDYLRKMSTTYDGFPVLGNFVRLIAQEQFNQKRGLAQRLTKRMIVQETDAELDRRLQEAAREAEKEITQRLIGPLERLQLNPTVMSMSTTDSRLTIRYRVANTSQLAGFTARPRAPSESLLSMQVHQSAINNAISQLGLSGRTWTLSELAEHLGKILMQPNWQAPEDVSDVTIRFADTRPITVEMKDGQLRLTLRIAELSQASRRLDIRQFLVSSNYIPVAEGLDATLVRDGVVEIVTSRRKDRVPLRFIFAKIFVSHPEVPLISESWQADERAHDLAVSQLDIRDGWLAVAIAPADSAQAAEVAAKARLLKMQ